MNPYVRNLYIDLLGGMPITVMQKGNQIHYYRITFRNSPDFPGYKVQVNLIITPKGIEEGLKIGFIDCFGVIPESNKRG